MRDLILPAIVAAVVAAIVALVVGPWQASREEAGRLDRVARLEVARRLRTLRLRLRQEMRRRMRLQGGSQVPRGDPMTIYEFENVVWYVLKALDDPALNRGFADRVHRALQTLMGAWRVEYLSILPDAPVRPSDISETTRRIMETEAFEQPHDTSVDVMFQQNQDPQAVERVIAEIERIIDP